ncbi:hypothetical protein ACFV9C_41100 [Kribbella sp. NPDC059898]|uniref:hypothetical protein n=1 Tax=Kribbella sp. NPDC059898 TaxID=3346995 RepID=UPI003650AECC
MTRVDPSVVYEVGEGLYGTGLQCGPALTRALEAISVEAVQAACGHGPLGKDTFDGYSTRIASLAGAGAALQESMTNIAVGLSGAAGLLEQTDGENAERIKAADLGLQLDGTALPETADVPAPESR